MSVIFRSFPLDNVRMKTGQNVTVGSSAHKVPTSVANLLASVKMADAAEITSI